MKILKKNTKIFFSALSLVHNKLIHSRIFRRKIKQKTIAFFLCFSFSLVTLCRETYEPSDIKDFQYTLKNNKNDSETMNTLIRGKILTAEIVDRKRKKKRKKIHSKLFQKRLSYKKLKYFDVGSEHNQSVLISSPGQYVRFPDNFDEVITKLNCISGFLSDPLL